LKRVLITGGKGQDGTLLKQLLESQGIDVFSISRPTGTTRLMQIPSTLDFETSDRALDLSDFETCIETIGTVNPDAIFHLAAVHAPSHVMNSSEWDRTKEETYNTHVVMTKNLIDSLIEVDSKAQLIVAGSSRMYTPNQSTLVVDESTATNPSDYYGLTKDEAWRIIRNERERTGLALKMAILFNHESKLRRDGFLFRDLASQITSFESGKQDYIAVSNPLFRGDWHSATNTVEGLQLMASNKEITDLVLASGKLISVSQIINDYFDSYPSNRRPKIISKHSVHIEQQQFAVVGNIDLAVGFGWRASIILSNVLREMVESAA
jgi:GDPmannose 4,6-dehydratase